MAEKGPTDKNDFATLLPFAEKKQKQKLPQAVDYI
jgi:hypothetical protein